MIWTIRLAVATAVAAAGMAAATPAHADAPCVRTSDGGPYWEVCVQHNGCTVYVWSTMPPSICV